MSQILMTALDVLAAGEVPDPPAKDLPGNLGTKMSDLIGYAKTICLILAVLGGLASAGMMVIGIRGRSNVAKDAISHLPYVVGGSFLVGGIAGLIQAFQ